MSMKMASFWSALAMFATAAVAAAQVPTQPSPASQALAACVVRSATPDDNVTLVKWFFFAMARHPSIVQYMTITDQQRVEVNREMGALTNRLLIQACPNELRTAYQSDGNNAVGVAFQALGQHAGEALLQNPDVKSAVIEVTPYLDRSGLAALTVHTSPTQHQ
jgi:hypothetical protein